ncbi:MAG TPA: hypothetical protein VH234_02245 [Candidatus Saccharimonadales bacterium]|jgi:hypothetical protein|nr:hypothetical protein [Candidatus Saccharimonadales bacterium]
MLAIEDQYPADLRKREAEAIVNNDPLLLSYGEDAIEFHESQGQYLYENDLFTDTESIILSNMLQFGSLGSLANHLETSTAKLSKILNPLCERVGITSNSTWQKPDPYIELMLIAMSLKMVNIEHIVQGKTDGLAKIHRKVLAEYYSPNPKVRQNLHNTLSSNIISTRWAKLYRNLGLNLGMENRHMAVLYAVRDKALQLPDPDTIRAQLARTPDPTPTK